MKLGKKITMQENTFEKFADACSLPCNICTCGDCSDGTLLSMPNYAHGTKYGVYNSIYITKY